MTTPVRRQRIDLYVGPEEMVTRADLATLEATGKYLVEEKHDGQWAICDVVNGKIARIRSRVGLDQGGADAEGIMFRQVAAEKSHGLIVGELTADLVGDQKCGTRRLHLFDIIEWNDENLRQNTLTSRCSLLEKVINADDRVFLVEQRMTGFQAYYDSIVGRKGEGVVLKERDSIYVSEKADGKVDFWKRAKPRRTVDYVVLAHRVAAKGTPTVDVGLWKQTKSGLKLVKVQTVTVVSLNVPAASLVNRVVEVEGYEVFPSGAVRHGHLVRVRDDKAVADCTYDAAMKA